MAQRDISSNPWVFNHTKQGEGLANAAVWLRLGTFTSTFASNLINYTGHGYVTGDGPIRVEEGNSDLPSGLAEDTDYWIIRVDADSFNLASSAANAAAGTAVAIADDGTTPNYILSKPAFDKTKLFISTILIDAGAAGGTFNVTTTASGKSLTGILELAANTHEQIVIDQFVDGVYITSLADGQILVYHGQPRW